MNPNVTTGKWVKSFIYPFILSFIASQHPVFYAYGMEGILFDPDDVSAFDCRSKRECKKWQAMTFMPTKKYYQLTIDPYMFSTHPKL